MLDKTLTACLIALLWACSQGAVAIPLVERLPTQQQPLPDPEARHYQQGIDALKRGDLASAGAAFEQSLGINPDFVQSRLGLIEIAFQRGDLDAAGQQLEALILKAPDNSYVQSSWGRYLYLKRRYPEAEAALDKAISLDPSVAAAYIDLGELYLLALDQPARAEVVFRSALVLDNSRGGTHFGLGRALRRQGRLDEAESAFLEAARLGPSTPLPHQALGGLNVLRGRHDAALKNYTRAIEIQPDFLAAYLSRGDVYASLGKEQKALADYASVSQRSASNSLALVKAGMLHQSAGRIPDAEQAYLRAIERNPQEAIAYNNLAWMAAERKARLDDALDWANRAVALEPGAATYQDTLAWVQRARGNLSKAEAVLEKVRHSDAATPGMLYHLGIIYQEQGKAREAREAFKSVLAQDERFARRNDIKQRLGQLADQ